MQQPILAWNHLYKSPVRHDAFHLAFIFFSNFNRRRERNGLDAIHRSIDGRFVTRRNFDDSLSVNVFNADSGPRFRLNFLDDLSTWADDRTNGFTRHLKGHNAWRVIFVVCARFRQAVQHLAPDVVPTFPRLSQGLPKLLEAQALDFDVHLTGSDAMFGAGDLEVHVPEVIFIPQNV